jgi:DNA (cytosine-5)-methyltransferase 1
MSRDDKKEMTINYLDLFSGIGGFALGLQMAGFTFNKHYFSEIDKYARSIYEKQFTGSIGLGDITGVNGKELGEIDLITFGFPCQDLSIAGKRAGLEGNRSSLFFEAIRLIQELQPEIFIFENVKGVFSSNEGQDFEIILRTIADIGLYECEWQLLNTSWFLPQNRERLYFIGHLRRKSRPKVFPIGEIAQKATQERDGRYISGTISTKNQSGQAQWDGSTTLIELTENMPDAQRIYDINGIAKTLKGEGGGQGAKTGLYAIRSIGLKDGSRKYYNDTISQCLSSNPTSDNLPMVNTKNVRRLTPIECERLQGFPDGWTEGISDTQRYKCLGNAVSVPVVEEIGRRLLK